MNSSFLKPLTVVILLASLTACNGLKDRTLDYIGKRPTTGQFFTEDETSLVELNYDAGDEIAGMLNKRLPAGSPITVQLFRLRGNPLVTDFAKITTEQVASRIAQKGFAVVADASHYPTKAKDEDMPDPVKCVLTGAYSIGPYSIFLTAAVTTVDEGQIIGSWDWTVPLNKNTRSLLPHDEDNPLVPMVNTTSPYQADNPDKNKASINQDSFTPAPGFEENIR
jgi:hypothetical protein